MKESKLKTFGIPFLFIVICLTGCLIFMINLRRSVNRDLFENSYKTQIEFVEQTALDIKNGYNEGVLPAGAILSLDKELTRGRIYYWFLVNTQGKPIQSSDQVGNELALPYTDDLRLVTQTIYMGERSVQVMDISYPVNRNTSIQLAFPMKSKPSFISNRTKSYILFNFIFAFLITLLMLMFMIYLIKKNQALKIELIKANKKAYLGEISGSLAHELKNPLNTVKMNIQLIRESRELSENEGLMKKIGRIERELDHLTNFLMNFLQFAKTPALTLSKIDLNDLVSSVVRFFAPECIASGITLRFIPETSPVMLRADEKQIKQLLLNLLLHAKQAS